MRPLILAAAVAAAAQVAVLWLTDMPLGVPGEWVWDRVRFDAGDAARLFLGLLAATAAAIAIGAVAFAGASRVGRSRRGEVAWLVLLVGVSFWWLWAVQSVQPIPALGLDKGPLVLFLPGSEGYFTLAREEADDLPAFLAGYERRMAGDVLHIGTHPPGLAVLHWTLLAACRGSDGLTRLLLASRPASVVEANAIPADMAAAEGRPLSPSEAAALWAAVLLTQLAAAATVVPLYALARTAASPAAAWRAASLWPLVPAVAVFLPKSDLFYPLLGTLVLALWHRPGGPSWQRGAVAGAAAGVGMTLSLAMLPVLVLAAGLAVTDAATAAPDRRAATVRRWAVAAIAATVVFAAATAAVWMTFGLDLIGVWRLCLANHAGFYEEYHRTYAAWLAVNPFELAFALGLPAAVVAATAIVRDFAARRWSPALPCLATFALLWLSGKTSGEAARLWLFLMPWALWSTASLWHDGRTWRAVWTFQFVAGTATVLRVTGFDFARMAGLAV